MKRNEEITSLSGEITSDLVNNSLPLHSVLLKCARLSQLLDMPGNMELFKKWAQFTEENYFFIQTFQINIEAAKDPNISLSSSNPNEYVRSPFLSNLGNHNEREGIRDTAKNILSTIATYRTEAYRFALDVNIRWKFGDISESIFEKKRKKVQPILEKVLPDINQRLNSIEQNLRSENQEDWKNAVTSCRTLMMDIADKLNPPRTDEEKRKYMNRLKDFILPQIESSSKRDLLAAYLEELKERIECTISLTQGGAHKDRPTLDKAEDVVLYTYLALAELMAVYGEKELKSAQGPVSQDASDLMPETNEIKTTSQSS